jgi:Tfp pilus assembly protein PilF
MRITHHGWLAASLIFTAVTSGAAAQTHNHGNVRLGTVTFKVECNAAAQQEFHRGVAYLHSFAFPQARASFEAVAKADPACGMAHWGRAMMLLDNPFIWPAGLTPQKLNDVVAALDTAQAAGLKSPREQGYVAALGALVRDHATVPHAQRLQKYDDAMAALAKEYPDDMEAAIFSALATSANFVPTDKTYANQLKAARVLEPLFKAHPNHPGVAHYIIHTFDYPPIAKHGVEAAKLYGSIAPDAPHAQHMPAHIFTRIGYWNESIASNRASAKAAGDATFDAHHAFDYMVYAHLQLAQDGAARRVLAESQAMKLIDHFGAAFAYVAMPARLALERGEWAEAAALPMTPAADAYPWKKYPQAEAINAFARGVGAARAGNVVRAREQQSRLIALRDAAKELKLAYWAEQLDIQAALVEALVQCADGKVDDCIKGLKAAATREDATEKHAVVPGPLLPARELLGDMLLDQGKFAEALAEYEAVMKKEPNRYRAIAGAMAAARGAGDQAKARAFAAELLKLGSDADSQRASLHHAKQLAGG